MERRPLLQNFRRPQAWGIAAWTASIAVAISLAVPGQWIPQIVRSAESATHAAAFAVTCGLWALAGRARLGVVLVLGVTAAIGTEWLQQAVVPLRTGSASDALANTLGVAIGAGVAFALRRQKPVPDLPSPRRPGP